MNPSIEKLLDLSGKVAIITGGAKGIGYGITVRLAQAGAKCAICGRNATRVEEVSEQMRGFGLDVYGFGCDVGDEDSVVGFVKNVVEKFGTVDILVNNAGNYPPNRLEDVSAAEWDSVFASNVRGMFLCTREVVNEMKAKGHGGSIINCSSIGAFRCNFVGMSAYHSSKGAMLSFTNHEAAEQGPYGIRVNSIAVGAVEAQGDNKGVFTPDTIDFNKPIPNNAVPIGRFGCPADIGNTCLYLASDLGSYVNGVYITVDGGMTRVPTFGYKELPKSH